ncbi:hypothetical protein QTN25_010741 [Entamoeba marina]
MEVIPEAYVLLFDYSSTVPKDIIKCPEIIASAIDSDTVNGNALIGQKIIYVLLNWVVKEKLPFILHGIFLLFNSIYYEKNPEYHYVVAVTNPFNCSTY